jgi:autotransporter-associated beta strand protein
MNTSLSALAKIGAVVFSSALAALFVYDRATGGAFYRRLTDPSAAAVDATRVSTSDSPSTEAAASDPASGAEPPRILFSGSKSYSGGTQIAGGTLEVQSHAPSPNGPSIYPPGASPYGVNLPGANTSDALPPTVLMSGSKSLLVAPVQQSSPARPVPAAPTYSQPTYSPAPNPPPYANSPAYANVPLTADEPGGPARKTSAPNLPYQHAPPGYVPPNAGSNGPPNMPTAAPAGAPAAASERPGTLMMGTKSAPVFSPPTQQSPPQTAPSQTQQAAPSQPRFVPKGRPALPPRAVPPSQFNNNGDGRQVPR